ncbi:MAG TPA: XRE family transcriptional regulator [bacterium]|nr:XRE family transcriptional regulator [bacterium]
MRSLSSSIDKDIGLRIKEVRTDVGITQGDLAKEIGVGSAQIISDIEQGKRALKASELNKLANALFKDPVFFLKIDKSKGKPALLYRGDERCEVGSLGKVGAYFIQKCEQYRHLETLLDKKPASQLYQEEINITHTREDYAWADKLGNQTRKLFQLGARPARVLCSILEQIYNIKIWFKRGMDKSACATITDFGPAILINSEDSPWRRNYDLAHELFHLITWESFIKQADNDPDWHDQLEKLADVFASTLLLPEEEIRSEFASRIRNDSISYLDLINIARDFEVSTSALLWRFVNIGLLKRKDILSALQDRYFKAQDKSERVGDWLQPPDFPDRFVQLAITAHNIGRLAKGQLARYLQTSIPEVEDVVREYGYNLGIINGSDTTSSFRC